ncbi:23 kDa integral membrane protein-like isoform X2 [Zeugodacus cucurbitae]|nr:23 kDa integral membrane protein-like isoform X2 [Zeugodacus cucurbitae]
MKELGSESKPVCISLIVLGVIIFVIAFFGCCGALTENLCCIWMYAVILIILLVCNVVISIYVKGFNSAKYARDNMDSAWRHMVDGTEVTMHLYQSSMECCGKKNSNDYTSAGMSIPMSCYRDYTMIPSHLYIKGCIDVLTKMYKKSHKRLYIFTWIVFGIEAVCLVFAIALAAMYHLEYTY